MPKLRSALVLLSLVLGLGCDRPSRTPVPARSDKTFKVMTFNVNYGVPGDADSLAAIRDSGADLVLLQETTVEWERHIRAQLSQLYPHMAFRHCCGAGGLAILSKGAIGRGEYLEARTEQRGWFPAWRHVVSTPVGTVQALNVHLRPPISEGGSLVGGYFTTGSVRRKEIESFFASLDDSLPTVIAGDFNEDEDGRAVRYLRGKGLRSVLPEYQPSADTWRWRTSVGTVHSRLDHVVYDRRFEPLDAAVLKKGRSDHWPVIATFEKKP